VLKDFREFILRGNVVDLAVAVVVGAAFGAVVSALVADVLTPLIAAVGGEPDFGALSFELNGSRVRYGHFLNAVVSFLLVSSVLFFVVVKPLNALLARRKARDAPAPAAPAEEVVLLTEIRDLLKAGDPRP
jgi:large conductance mechanosensitive channel